MRICIVGASGKLDAVLKSNRTRRVDFALFMVAALENHAALAHAPSRQEIKA